MLKDHKANARVNTQYKITNHVMPPLSNCWAS